MNEHELILTVDDDPQVRMVIAQFLTHQAYRVIQAESAQEAIQLFEQEKPNLVLLDADMPDMNGFELCKYWKQNEKSKYTPIVMLTGLDDHESVDKAFAVGAEEFIIKPVNWAVLKHRIQNILVNQKMQHDLRLADKVFNAREGIMVTDKDGCILKVNPSACNITGYEENELIGKNPHVLSSGLHDKTFYKAMWQQIMTKGYWEGEIINLHKQGHHITEALSIVAVYNKNKEVSHYVSHFTDITAKKQLEKEIEHLAFHDALTGLANRILFLENLEQMISWCKRYKKLSAVLFLDLDKFKVLNDTLGHDAGDDFLKHTATELTHIVRKSDTVARFGGDEFVILLGELIDDQKQAKQQVLKVVKKIHQIIPQSFNLNNKSSKYNTLENSNLENNEFRVTVSIGVTIFPVSKQYHSTRIILKQADEAMYKAKKAGVNQVNFY